MLGVSLIMATAGRSREVCQLLGSLERQTSCGFELIIVDQNEDDRLQPVLRRARKSGMDIRHLKHPVKSLSGARNAGLVLARHEVVAFPDDDCWYDEHVIRHVIEHFACDARLDGLVARWVEHSPAETAAHFLSLGQARQFRGVLPNSITLFLRTSLVLEIGGFDEMLGIPGWFGSGEETDLIIRCLEHGAALRFLPDVRVHHRFGSIAAPDSLKLCRNARTFSHGTGALYAKHRLALRVILRGLAGPLIKMPPPRPSERMRALVGACIAIGRLEGMVRWLYLSYCNRTCRRARRANPRGTRRIPEPEEGHRELRRQRTASLAGGCST